MKRYDGLPHGLDTVLVYGYYFLATFGLGFLLGGLLVYTWLG